MDGYEDLANTIILQAAKDYRMALKSLKANPDNFNAQKDRNEIEAFFQSQWFEVLTNLDGKELMLALQREVMS